MGPGTPGKTRPTCRFWSSNSSWSATSSRPQRAAELWRFLPKGFKKYYNNPDPASIERRADAEVPLQQIIADWPVGTDPEIHIAAIKRLFDSGATIVNIHSGQQNQQKVIEFYGKSVLPKFARASSNSYN